MNDMTRGPAIDPQVPAVIQNQGFSLVPRNLEEALKFSKLLSQSELVPKDFQGKEANCFVAMQWGLELGMPPLQAMQNIAVINGRPKLWGDSVIALVRSSPLCEWIEEEVTDTQATVSTKRRGAPKPTSRTFTMDDAKKAGLAGKQGPWSQYPKRMLQMRARDWCLRDVYPDVLRGMGVAEVAMDEPIDVTAQGSHTTERAGVGAQRVEPSLPVYSDEAFKTNLPKWLKAIADGKTTPAEVIAKVETKHTLTADQLALIRGDADPAAPEAIAAMVERAAKGEIAIEDLCKHLKVEKLEGITKAQLAACESFIADPAGAAK